MQIKELFFCWNPSNYSVHIKINLIGSSSFQADLDFVLSLLPHNDNNGITFAHFEMKESMPHWNAYDKDGNLILEAIGKLKK